MKLKIALLAAALVAAPFSAAFAEDAAPAAEAAVEAPAADAAVDAAVVAAYEVSLKDGTKVSIEGDHASVVAADGTKSPAPDGDHVLADDTTMTVAGGVITAGKPAAPAAEAPAADAPAEAPADEHAH